MSKCKDWCTCCEKCIDKYNELAYKTFTSCPFTICLKQDMMLNMDEPFVTKHDHYIVLHDDRRNNPFYELVEEEDRYLLTSDMKVYRKYKRPITLRQILNEMVLSSFYNNTLIIQDEHRFLEGFVHIMGSVYEPIWGS